MKVSVFCGTSLDGFLARPDGAIDFLPADGGGAETGFDPFFASVDCLVMGRGTFETALSFPGWPYGDKRVVVLSGKPLVRGNAPATVEHMSGEPKAIHARLAKQGVQHAYIDGGLTIQGFLRAGLVDRIVVTFVPVLIGAGRPLFGPLPKDIRLELESSRPIGGGMVQSTYAVQR